jgi:hypothetical protein
MPHWIGEFWTGNQDANAVTGAARPRVLDAVEWDESELRCRAEVMTVAPGHPVSSRMVLSGPAPDATRWWEALRRNVDAVAATPTARTCLAAHTLAERVESLGGRVDLTALVWTTAHGDLHWGNLTVPQCWLLDWEAWGTAPAGYDAASLLCVSLPDPAATAHVRTLFADVLDTPTGRIAQLAAVARFLRLSDSGEYPGLAPLLHAHTAGLIAEESQADRR